MQEFLTNLANSLGLAWWVEVNTETPRCTYYFGPFLKSEDAEKMKPGYIEDLEQEGAQGIAVTVKRCKPSKLTVAEDLGERSSRGTIGTLSGQLQ